MTIKKLLCVLMIFPFATFAQEKMPCQYVQNELISGLSYYSKDQTPEFLECIKNFRVCVVMDGKVFSAPSIKELDDTYGSVTYVIVQSPANDDKPVCLIGQYSGGSAAAWVFSAYEIYSGNAKEYLGMHKAYAQGDAFSPKSSAKLTYEMFEKYAEKTP